MQFIRRLFVNQVCSFIRSFEHSFGRSFDCWVLLVRTGPHNEQPPWLRRKEFFLTEVVNPLNARMTTCNCNQIELLISGWFCNYKVILTDSWVLKTTQFIRRCLLVDNEKLKNKFISKLLISLHGSTSKFWQGNIFVTNSLE